MKKFILVLLLGVFGQAQAVTIDANSTPLTFDWNSINWSGTFQQGTAIPGGGAVANTGHIDYLDDSLVTITGSNGDASSSPMMTQMTTTDSVSTAGFVDFSWDYGTDDAFALPSFDPFFFVLDTSYLDNGTFPATIPASTGTLLNLFGEDSQSGLASIWVDAGSIFGFAIQTRGNTDGPAWVEITDFSFGGVLGQPDPSAVPVPPALLLFGTALAGLFTRKRKTVATTA